MPSVPSTELETFPNPGKEPYFIDMVCPEFTCLCPKTGQPDFATIRLRYVPDGACVELKSLKMYLWNFRNEGKFHEAVTHEIADKIQKLIKPKYLRVVGDFWIRGGIYTAVRVSHGEVPEALKNEPDPENVQFGKIPGFGR